MKTYLHIFDIEADDNELIIKVEPLYCADNSNNPIGACDKDYDPTKGDKLYFLPGVNIPRIKLKDLTLKYGIKTVREFKDATVMFGSDNTASKLSDSHHYYQIPVVIIKVLLFLFLIVKAYPFFKSYIISVLYSKTPLSNLI